MVTKKYLISRMAMLEDMVFELISAHKESEDVCKACRHQKCYTSVRGRIVRYCELFAKSKCADFTPEEIDLQASGEVTIAAQRGAHQQVRPITEIVPDLREQLRKRLKAETEIHFLLIELLNALSNKEEL